MKRKPKAPPKVRFASFLPALIERCAVECEAAELAIDANPGGKLHQWIMANCFYRSNQEFLIVKLLAAELADREARRKGFESQADRAAAFKRPSIHNGESQK
jgi:hypothetical protein